MGGRVLGGVGICTEETEYRRAIHCDATNYGPLRRNGADEGYMGCEKVMGLGGTGPDRRAGSGG